MSTMDLFKLDGKVALITGACRGLGQEMALAFAEAGADIIAVDKRDCDETVAKVQALGRRAAAYSCHLGHWDEINDLVEIAYKDFGHVDILVNNAGMSPLYDSLVEVSEALYDTVMSVNLKGPFRLSSLIGDKMAQGNGGAIINISSIASIMPSNVEIPYAAAKAGLNNLTVSLSKYYGPKVRANTIMCGPFRTAAAANWPDEMIKHIEDISSLNRCGLPEEIIGAAMYFASEASSFTTGATLVIDGGCTS